MTDPKNWLEDDAPGDEPDDVVEVEHEAHEEEVPAEVLVGTGDDDCEVVYGCIRVEPGISKRGTGGTHIIDERGDRRRVVR